MMKKRQEVKGTKCVKDATHTEIIIKSRGSFKQCAKSSDRSHTQRERVRQHAADTLIVTAVCVAV
jgi:hypothetical protein